MSADVGVERGSMRMAIAHEPGNLDLTLTEARRMLDALRARGAAAEGGEPAPDQAGGQATALDGLVTVSANGAGRIESITVDPQARRLPLADLAEAITEAANAALAEAARTPAGEALDVDFGALAEQVQRMQDDSLRQMARFTGALDEVMERLGKRT
jgi:hypothetical protein